MFYKWLLLPKSPERLRISADVSRNQGEDQETQVRASAPGLVAKSRSSSSLSLLEATGHSSKSWLGTDSLFPSLLKQQGHPHLPESPWLSADRILPLSSVDSTRSFSALGVTLRFISLDFSLFSLFPSLYPPMSLPFFLPLCLVFSLYKETLFETDKLKVPFELQHAAFHICG